MAKRLPQTYDLSPLARDWPVPGEPLQSEAGAGRKPTLAGDGKWGYVVDNWWQTELADPRWAHR